MWLWWVGEWVGVCEHVSKITQHRGRQKRQLSTTANMSTEIKLVYYFQRGKKKLRNKKAVIFYTSDYY